MRILSICNISNFDDLEADSGVIFQRVLANELAAQGLEYILALPAQAGLAAKRIPGATIEPMMMGPDRYSARFQVDWGGLTRLTTSHHPDVIFVNQIELTSAVRAHLVSLNLKIPIVAYCHYPPSYTPDIDEVDPTLDHQGMGAAIIHLVAAALETADAIVTQSAYAKSILMAIADKIGYRASAEIHVVPPPSDPEISPTPSEVRHAPPASNVLYNHRLYASYGTEAFIAFLEGWSGASLDVAVANPMPNRSQARSTLSSSPAALADRLSRMPNVRLLDGATNRPFYREIVASAGVSFAPHRPGCVWSMAAVDCLSWGVPVIAPRMAAYPEFIPAETLYGDWEEAASILARLIADPMFYRSARSNALAASSSVRPATIARSLASVFDLAIRGRKCVE